MNKLKELEHGGADGRCYSDIGNDWLAMAATKGTERRQRQQLSIDQSRAPIGDNGIPTLRLLRNAFFIVVLYVSFLTPGQRAFFRVFLGEFSFHGNEQKHES